MTASNTTAKRSVLGLFADENSAADALDAIAAGGYTSDEYEVLTGMPYPEGTFGDAGYGHKLFRFPIIGATVGLIVGLVLTVGTQLVFPLETADKPILSIPPVAVIVFATIMLGAILSTVVGLFIETRAPASSADGYDARVNEGWIGVVVTADEGRIGAAEEILKQRRPGNEG
jgi:hypothetical protein